MDDFFISSFVAEKKVEYKYKSCKSNYFNYYQKSQDYGSS